jgi:hypothetical protein
MAKCKVVVAVPVKLCSAYQCDGVRLSESHTSSTILTSGYERTSLHGLQAQLMQNYQSSRMIQFGVFESFVTVSQIFFQEFFTKNERRTPMPRPRPSLCDLVSATKPSVAVSQNSV